MKFNSCSADAFGQVDVVVNNAGIPNLAPLTAWQKDSVRVQPTAKQFAPPNQPDVSASDASDIDKLYRQLIGPPPATSSDSRLWAAPSDDAAGSVRRWASPR